MANEVSQKVPKARCLPGMGFILTPDGGICAQCKEWLLKNTCVALHFPDR